MGKHLQMSSQHSFLALALSPVQVLQLLSCLVCLVCLALSRQVPTELALESGTQPIPEAEKVSGWWQLAQSRRQPGGDECVSA